MSTTQKIELIFLFIGIIAFGTLGMYWLAKQANKFFREADRIEEMIRDGAELNEIHAALLKLSKDSFHRQTGSRVSELVKMTEVKYNIEFVKK